MAQKLYVLKHVRTRSNRHKWLKKNGLLTKLNRFDQTVALPV